jgi:arginyl-tRNA synthetase
MLKDMLTVTIDRAVSAARESGAFAVETLPAAGIERTRDQAHGDYATNIAMVLAKQAKKNPLEIAKAIAAQIPPDGPLAGVEVAPPGFINFRLSPAWLTGNLAKILADGAAYGRGKTGQGTKVLLEFVSANPTGPLHVGHGRWAAIGSALANLLKTAGFEVASEFYINDAGNQMLLLGRSVEARMRELQGEPLLLPDDGYQGAYISDVAEAALAKLGAATLELPEAERVAKLTDFARDYLLAVQQDTLAQLRTHFDVYFSERTLHPEGVLEAIEHLKTTENLYLQDGAWWLRSTPFGDDKDRVVLRENGQPTYLAADVAYHWSKLRRGHEVLVNILGADHHGYVARLTAAVQALGGKPDTLRCIIGQMVNLFRDGEPVRMSKRSGEMVTLQDVIDEVGADAARYFLIMRSTDTTLDFDLALAKRETADNPVFYVQYAHARICSILRLAAEQGVATDQADLAGDAVREKLENDERNLLMKLAAYPDEIAAAAMSMEPYRLARYAQELATTFHQFYTTCRVLTEDVALTRFRLALIQGVRIVLRNVMEDVLGVSAPERMEKEAAV